MFIRGLVCRDEFAHRVNNDDTVDSICLHCFGTVASLQMEADLHVKEAAHLCWQREQHIKEIQSARKSARLVEFPGRSAAPDETRIRSVFEVSAGPQHANAGGSCRPALQLQREAAGPNC
jgi:hypothetical protein